MADRALKTLQAFIADAVANPLPIDADLARSAGAERHLVPGSRGLGAGARLDIYREQFWLRHLANLRDDFPTLAFVLGGPQALDDLSTQYLRAYPPRTWDLQRLGADLPGFVQAHAQHHHDARARDASRLDWAFVEAFDAPDAPPLDLSVVASAPEDAWPGARLVFHPSLRRLALAHPIHELRDALGRSESPALPAAADARVVVWRDAACRLRSAALEPIAFDLLDALGRGIALGHACESAARDAGTSADDVGARVGEWFQRWTANGWVSAVVLGD